MCLSKPTLKEENLLLFYWFICTVSIGFEILRVSVIEMQIMQDRTEKSEHLIESNVHGGVEISETPALMDKVKIDCLYMILYLRFYLSHGARFIWLATNCCGKHKIVKHRCYRVFTLFSSESHFGNN